jgi:hypothetical protein
MSDPPPHQGASGSGGDHPTTEQINRVASAFESYTGQQKATDAKSAKHDRKIRRWTRAATAGALAYTLITTFVLIASIRSIQETRRATHYASVAAQAATAQAKTSEDTEKRQLRAYVGVLADFGIVCPGCANKDRAPKPDDNMVTAENKITMIIKNFGLTPAYHPIICVDVKEKRLKENLTKNDADLLFLQCDHSPVQFMAPTIWPNDNGRTVFVRLDNQEVAALIAVRKNTGSAYLFGRVQYEDIFLMKRWSYFSFQYYFKQDSGEDGFFGTNSPLAVDN